MDHFQGTIGPLALRYFQNLPYKSALNDFAKKVPEFMEKEQIFFVKELKPVFHDLFQHWLISDTLGCTLRDWNMNPNFNSFAEDVYVLVLENVIDSFRAPENIARIESIKNETKNAAGAAGGDETSSQSS